MKAKKLIEIALPIKEISAESVRDKSIRHGHISTLHLWWARRPLPVCRAIVFASLVPDPLDENCPQAFKDAVYELLNPSNDILTQYMYMPYTDIPYTSVADPMEDNLRNRLMMFIGKFSDICQKNMMSGKSTPPKDQLTDGSLIKWENRNNPKVLSIARELIWVAYNAEQQPELGYETHHRNFTEAFSRIKEAEDALYGIVDRHIITAEVDDMESNLNSAIDMFLSHMPSVFDPFAGGGAIPLEAARLGCRSYGNDINPVAHIIEKGSAEFPQKYGKPILYSEKEFITLYGERGIKMSQEAERNIVIDSERNYHIPNRLSWDVEYYAKEILELTENKMGCLYPADNDGTKPIAYYWVRTAKCSNPSCNAVVPMMKGFYLCNTSKKRVYLNPIISENHIAFEIKEGLCNLKGWNNRGNLICPCCGSITSVNQVKEQFRNHTTGERLVATICENNQGKYYRLPNNQEFKILNQIPNDSPRPNAKMEVKNTRNFNTPGWGLDNYGQIFSDRQICTLNEFVSQFKALENRIAQNEYNKAVLTYLAIWIDRIAVANTSLGVWHTGRETLERIMSRQAIPMTFDYPESNPFCKSSGSALNQLEWISRYFESESSNCFHAIFANASSGEKSQFDKKTLTSVVTDPPYYDAIAYADISDFFYVWMKKTLGDIYPLNFATPYTPKGEECTALKHHHNDNENEARLFFEKKLTAIFDAIEEQTSDVVSIMYAHQSTEAWTTLCNSILDARMNITGSWPMDTEMQGALKTEMAYLESSVTVSCRPSERNGYGDYKSVKKDIENKVTAEVESLYELGFRGADLLTACFGQAVSEFGKYKCVEKSDGSEVTVAELLEMARNAAFNALLKGVQGDDYTKFYIGWLQLNGTGETDFDDATKFTRVGVNVNIKDIQQEGLLILEGKKMHIAMAEEHIGGSSVEGTRPGDSLIKQAHRLIILYRNGDRGLILKFVREICPDSSSPLWRLLATLKELLPACDDLTQINGILQNAEDLRQHCHEEFKFKQSNLFENIDF